MGMLQKIGSGIVLGIKALKKCPCFGHRVPMGGGAVKSAWRGTQSQGTRCRKGGIRMKRAVTIMFVVFGVFIAHVVLAEQLSLSSPQFKPDGRLGQAQVFSGFGCAGKNISPALRWKDAPKNTKSFAITVYDPDAPTGSGWWHWVIFNIPSSVDHVLENAGNPDSGLAPKGSVQTRTDYGRPGYGGACPPVGDKPHRYEFTLYALDVETLDISADASAAMVGFFLQKHALSKATLTGYYSR